MKILDQSIPKRAYLLSHRFDESVEHSVILSSEKNQDRLHKYDSNIQCVSSIGSEAPDILLLSTPYLAFNTPMTPKKSQYYTIMQNDVKIVTIDMGWDLVLFPMPLKKAYRGRAYLAGLSDNPIGIDKNVTYFPISMPDLDIIREAKYHFTKHQVLSNLGIPDEEKYLVVTLHRLYKDLDDLLMLLKTLQKQYHIVFKLKNRSQNDRKNLKSAIRKKLSNFSFIVGYGGESYEVFSPFAQLTTIADMHIQLGKTSITQAEMLCAGIPSLRFTNGKFGRNNYILNWIIKRQWGNVNDKSLSWTKTEPMPRFFFTDNLIGNLRDIHDGKME